MHLYCAYFGGSTSGIWLTDEYMVPRISPGAAAQRPSTFIGDVKLMNVTPYICWCHITDEYILNSSVPTNTLGYVVGNIFIS
jgi:hypothetical protein